MSRRADEVTADYITAHRMGVMIRTPLENIAFFQAEHKAVVAHTKTNGSFVLAVPLHEIEATLAGKATKIHRSYLVLNDMLPGAKHWRTGSSWTMELMTMVMAGSHRGIVSHEIPVSRRGISKTKKLFKVPK